MPLGWKQKFKEKLAHFWGLIKVPSGFISINSPFENRNLKPRRTRFNFQLEFFYKIRLEIQTCMQYWWLAVLHIFLITHIYWTRRHFFILSRWRPCLHQHNISRYLWVSCKIEFASLLPLTGSSLSYSTTTGKNAISSV